MKKLFVFLLVGIILINCVSAVWWNPFSWFQEDSTLQDTIKDRAYINELRTTDKIIEEKGIIKEYSSNNKRIKITNDKKEVLIDLQLTSPYSVQGLIASKDTKVAEFYLADWESARSLLIEDMKAFDINKDYNEKSKTFWYKYGVEKEDCESGKCLTYTEWIRFNNLNELPKKNIKIGVFTDTIAGENIEWIPTIDGFEILEWAEYEVSTLSYAGNYSFTANESNPQGLDWGSSGSILYTVGDGNNSIHQYSASDNYNATSLSSSTKYKALASICGTAYNEAISHNIDGTTFYLLNSNGSVCQTTTASAWDISGLSYAGVTKSFTSKPAGFNAEGMKWQETGTWAGKMFWIIGGSSTDSLYQFNCSTAWDLSTCSQINDFYNLTGFVRTDGNGEFYGIEVKPDISRFYFSISGDGVNTLNTTINTFAINNYNISDSSYVSGEYYDLGDWVGQLTPSELRFNDDGTRMYVLTYNGDNSVSQYTIEPSLVPTVYLNIPANNTETIDNSITFNCSGNDIVELNNVSLIVNGVVQHTESNTGVTNISLQQTITLGLGSYNWTCNATSATNEVSTVGSRKLDIKSFVENSQTYNANVFETTNQTFTLNLSWDNTKYNSASSNLIYNGTVRTTTSNEFVNSTVFTSYISIPLVTSGASQNKSFYWNVTLTNATGTTTTSSSTNEQTVNRTYLAKCNATFTTPFINFTTRNAENPFPILNATFKSAYEWYINGSSGTIKRNVSFEDVTEGNSSFDFCMSPNLTYIVDAQVEVDATGYSPNFYYLDSSILTNVTTNTSLYLLNDSKATLTVLQVIDNIQNPLEDIIIHIKLYDVGTNNYYTVAMAKTSFDGEDVVYLNWYDSLYQFILYQNNSIIKTVNPYKISETPQIFEITEGITFDFDKFQDFGYSLYFNNLTNNFVFSYTKPSGEVDEVCLRVIKRGARNDTETCNSCETASSTTIYCSVTGKGNGTYIASIYATGSWWDLGWIYIDIGSDFSEDIYNLLGNDDGTFYAIMFSGICLAMMFISPVFAVLGLLLGILGGAALGFQLFNYAEFIGITVIGGLVIWLIQK